MSTPMILNWLANNTPTLLALAAVLLVAFFSARSLRRSRRLNGSKCATCPYAKGCCKGVEPPEGAAPCNNEDSGTKDPQ